LPPRRHRRRRRRSPRRKRRPRRASAAPREGVRGSGGAGGTKRHRRLAIASAITEGDRKEGGVLAPLGASPARRGQRARGARSASCTFHATARTMRVISRGIWRFGGGSWQ
jgi:hypothetical protein